MIYRVVISLLLVLVMVFAIVVSQDGSEQHDIPVTPAGAVTNPNYNL